MAPESGNVLNSTVSRTRFRRTLRISWSRQCRSRMQASPGWAPNSLLSWPIRSVSTALYLAFSVRASGYTVNAVREVSDARNSNPSRRYRVAGPRYFAGACFSVLAFLGVAVVLASDSVPLARGVAAVFTGGLIIIAVRTLRSSVTVYPDLCRVRTVFRTYSLRATSIAQFQVADTRTLANGATATLTVELVDGSTIRTNLASFRRADSSLSCLVQICEELNHWKARQK
jgi:hypothetical protein